MLPRLFATLALASSTVVTAQSSVYLPDSRTDQKPCNAIPFGSYGIHEFPKNLKYQTIVPWSILAGLTRPVIEEIGFAACSDGIGSFKTIKIKMAQSTGTKLVPEFAKNLGQRRRLGSAFVCHRVEVRCTGERKAEGLRSQARALREHLGPELVRNRVPRGGHQAAGPRAFGDRPAFGHRQRGAHRRSAVRRDALGLGLRQQGPVPRAARFPRLQPVRVDRAGASRDRRPVRQVDGSDCVAGQPCAPEPEVLRAVLPGGSDSVWARTTCDELRAGSHSMTIVSRHARGGAVRAQ